MDLKNVKQQVPFMQSTLPNINNEVMERQRKIDKICELTCMSHYEAIKAGLPT